MDEALYSATYVDNYIDSVENLPDDVQRHLSRIRDIDVQYRSKYLVDNQRLSECLEQKCRFANQNTNSFTLAGRRTFWGYLCCLGLWFNVMPFLICLSIQTSCEMLTIIMICGDPCRTAAIRIHRDEHVQWRECNRVWYRPKNWAMRKCR